MSNKQNVQNLIKNKGVIILLYLSIVVSIVSFVVLVNTNKKRDENRVAVVHTYHVLNSVNRLISQVKDAETEQMSYLLTGERSCLKTYQESIVSTTETLNQLKRITADYPEQQKQWALLEVLLKQKYQELQNSIDLKSNSIGDSLGSQVTLLSTDGKAIMDKIKIWSTDLESAEIAGLDQTNADLDFSARVAAWVLTLNAVFNVVILFLGIVNLTRQTKSRQKMYLDLELKNRDLLFDKGEKLEGLTEELAVNNLIGNLKNATQFINDMGDQKYNTQYQDLTPENQNLNTHNLAGALIRMRSQMQEVALEEKRRNWTTQGLALFADILRKNNQQIEEFFSDITSNLVKYLKANQAALFLINDEESSEKLLQMVACYAFDRKKYLNKEVKIGEGLVGQVYLERDVIYLTEIPNNYIKITSGLGDANPNSLLLVPLMVNEEILGVIEMASFNPFAEHEIEFVKKLSESIASTISSVKVNERTRRLLEASQQQSEELRAQEEEMRQNVEELSATQEEISRKGQEMESRINAINESGIASIEFDLNGIILDANDHFLNLMEYKHSEAIGGHHKMFVKPEYSRSEQYRRFWEDLAQGISKPGEFERITKSGRHVHIFGSYSIIRDANGRPFKVLKLATDLTSIKQKQQQAETEIQALQQKETEYLTKIRQLESQLNA